MITDPSLPVQNVDAKVNDVSAFYERTFAFLGREASAAIVLPYVWAKATGEVFEQTRSITRSGQGDMVLRLASNILGGPALTRKEFARAPQETTLGASLVVSMPTGQYDGTKLVNIGTNRWAFKPELGFSQPVGRWRFDLYAGAWFFTANDDFFGGQSSNAGPARRVAGPRHLYVPAGPVARPRWNVVLGRADDRRWRAPRPTGSTTRGSEPPSRSRSATGSR